ncbi:hypothetical protein ACVW19_001714 [Streptomyces sp. TE5632]
MIRDGRDGTPLRLLPWTTPEGAPCYLSTDDPHSRLSRLADELEADLLDSAETVLTQAKPLLADECAGGAGVALRGHPPRRSPHGRTPDRGKPRRPPAGTVNGSAGGTAGRPPDTSAEAAVRR